MGKKKPSTPRSRVRAALRNLWLRSRERSARLKADGYACQKCGIKQSRKKGSEVYVEVHHVSGKIDNWEKIIDEVYKELLCSPEKLCTLCKKCHSEK